MNKQAGGRLFFTNVRRGIVDEDEIQLVSVGIDIGSSTTHLAVSRITLERVDSHYIVASRDILFESDILFTPYSGLDEIDTAALKIFFDHQYFLAGVGFADINTGALILTGTALRRRNSRAIADIFSQSAGKFVAVSAGDGMEAILAAHGAGAVGLSAGVAGDVLNIDIGGGTTKFARCLNGEVREFTAIDIGARLIALDDEGRITRIEPAARKIAASCQVNLVENEILPLAALSRLAMKMADNLMEVISAGELSADTTSLLRLPALSRAAKPALVTFSGGVSEYIYGRALTHHGDLGQHLAACIADRIQQWGPPVVPATQGIRATVIGASQYTVQLSGSTVFISDLKMLPLRNIPAISLAPSVLVDEFDETTIADAIRAAINAGGIFDVNQPLALGYSWQGSASFARINSFCLGVITAFQSQVQAGQPLILVGNCDIGGLIGLHLAEELKITSPVISIDGIESNKFDFMDFGEMLDGSGAVPVIIKSLVFPGGHAAGAGRPVTCITKTIK